MSERLERVFTWVWRLNGLLLLFLGIVGVGAAAVLIFDISRFASRDRPEQQLTEIAGTNLSAQDLHLGAFQAIAGTAFLYAPLASSSKYIGSDSSGGLGSSRNLLFVDTRSKRAHWLLQGNNQTLPSFSFLMDPPANLFDDGEARKRDQVALAILVEVQKPEDHGVNKSAGRTLAVASADGNSVTTIADSIEGLLGYHQASKESALVFYVKDGSARVLELDPVSRVVRSDAALSSQEQSPGR